MATSILMILSILIGIWIIGILSFKSIKKFLKPNWLKRTVKITFNILLGFVSFWLIASLGGNVILSLFNSKDVVVTDEIKKFQKEFITEQETFKEKQLSTPDSKGNELDYYLYTKKGVVSDDENITTNKKVVIVHHGLSGSRYTSYKYIIDLQKTEYLKDAIFIAYDSRGWNDSVSRGKYTLGKIEGADLFKVIEDVNTKLEPSEIILYGYSMGGGTLYNTLNDYGDKLEDQKVSKVIIDSGYYELKRELSYYAKSLLGGASFLVPLIIDSSSWLYSLDVKEDIFFNTRDNVSKLDIPIALLHAKGDKVVSFEFSCEMNHERNMNGLDTFSWFTDKDTHVKLNKDFPKKFPEYINSFLSDSTIPDDVGVEGDCS